MITRRSLQSIQFRHWPVLHVALVILLGEAVSQSTKAQIPIPCNNKCRHRKVHYFTEDQTCLMFHEESCLWCNPSLSCACRHIEPSPGPNCNQVVGDTAVWDVGCSPLCSPAGKAIVEGSLTQIKGLRANAPLFKCQN
jgi:hypothetical protein